MTELLQRWIEMQRLAHHDFAAALGDNLRTRYGDFPLTAEVLPEPEDNRVPIPRMWTEVMFTPAVSRGEIEINIFRGDVNVRSGGIRLTLKKLQILDLRSKGIEIKEICEKFGITESTESTHMQHAKHRLYSEEGNTLPMTALFVHAARVGLLNPGLLPLIRTRFELPEGSFYEDSDELPLDDEGKNRQPLSNEWAGLQVTPLVEVPKVEIRGEGTQRVYVRCKDVNLSLRELQTLDLRTRFRNKTIADMLFLSTKTLESDLRKPIERTNGRTPTKYQFFTHIARIGLLDPNLLPAIKVQFQIPGGILYEKPNDIIHPE